MEKEKSIQEKSQKGENELKRKVERGKMASEESRKGKMEGGKYRKGSQ